MDGVNGIRNETRTDCHHISQDEIDRKSRIRAQEDRLESIIEPKIAASVHNDTHARDNKATVQTTNAIRLHGLNIHINQAIELAFTTLLRGFGVICETGTGIVK